ncbi:hypothetical protein J2Y69_002190 [Microbacterium resistens]|uniref:DUF4190 domain-containing protein n=1 Tax=Microbacterium resistens TaxID=156977 RepID=A0ABU1SDA4_9MICO|nr:hypothetical protein [Microbacterium resistens]MDR6867586.1 hypothetical protein [Microbacterium resistens]
MTDPALAPRPPLWGLIATWATGLVVAVAIGIIAPPASMMTWFIIGFGLCVLVSFAVQLARAEARGFILRVATGALGALLAMGVVSVGFGVGALFAV